MELFFYKEEFQIGLQVPFFPRACLPPFPHGLRGKLSSIDVALQRRVYHWIRPYSFTTDHYTTLCLFQPGYLSTEDFLPPLEDKQRKNTSADLWILLCFSLTIENTLESKPVSPVSFLSNAVNSREGTSTRKSIRAKGIREEQTQARGEKSVTERQKMEGIVGTAWKAWQRAWSKNFQLRRRSVFACE